MTELEALQQRVDELEMKLEAVKDAAIAQLRESHREILSQDGKLEEIAAFLKRIMLHLRLEPIQ